MGVLPVKPRTVEDGALYEEGFFVFELDEPPDRPFVVKADGTPVPMDPDGRYRLRRAPSRIEVERCAGPFYALRPTYVLSQAAIRNANRRMLAAHVRMGGSAEPGEPGVILTIPNLLGDAPVQRDVARKVPMGEAK
jgi:hypothetical protein